MLAEVFFTSLFDAVCSVEGELSRGGQGTPCGNVGRADVNPPEAGKPAPTRVLHNSISLFILCASGIIKT